MSWLTWRQHRWDAASSAAVLVVLGGTMLVLATLSANLLAQISRACGATADCGTLLTEYQGSYGAWGTFLYGAGLVVPALVGVFVGAPLVAREFEQSTHLLVWAQGITRSRWFLSKLLMISVSTLIATGALGIAYETWLAPQGSITDLWYLFDVEPPVLIGYSLFALMLGVALGTLIQRTVPAMGATLFTFAVVRGAIEVFARANYVPPLTMRVGTPVTGTFLFVGSEQHVDLAGHAIGDQRWTDVLQQCSSLPTSSGKVGGDPLYDCLLKHGVLVIQHYQPDSRLWLFQGIEAAIFIALAVVLASVAYRLVLRKS